MNKLEQKHFEILKNKIKDDKLMKPLLEDVELKGEAIDYLNIIVAPVNPGEVDLELILKNDEHREKLTNILRQEVISKIGENNKEVHYETRKMEKKLEESQNNLKSLNSLIEEKKEQEASLIVKIAKLESKRDELEEERDEYERLAADLEKVKASLKEDRKKRHDIQTSILNEEGKKNLLLKEVEMLRDEKKGLNLDITRETNEIKEAKEKQKKELIKAYDEQFMIAKESLEEKKEEINSRKNELQIEIRELQHNKDTLQDNINKLRDEKKDILGKEEELKSQKMKLTLEREKVNRDKARINEIEEEITEEVRLKFQDTITDLEELINEQKDKIRQQDRDIRRLENLTDNSLEVGELQQQVNDLRLANNKLEERIVRKNGDNGHRILELTKELEGLKSINEEIRLQITNLNIEKSELLVFKDNIEIAERTLAETDRSKESLLNLLEKREEEIKNLKDRQESKEAKEERIEKPYFEMRQIADEEMPEKKWLDQLGTSFEEVGFQFGTRLLYAFHTSLKISDWSSLSVLAGVSGTGKSELPRLYSRYGGINFLPLAVQPDWDSPQSLFGYYNSLEGKFNATSLLNVLYQAQKSAKDSISDQLTIVLLDEMNLAHVELYFSELLSKLELLRGKSEGVNLEIDIAEKDTYKINLNNSIMWVGTMNEDETTKSLSDKVIDRGNLINFPRPNKLITRTRLTEKEEAPRLRKVTWDNWKWSEEKIDKLSGIIEKQKEVVEKINEALDGSGRAIGHRVWQSIENYVKNYPLVLMNLDNEEALNKYSQIAFEDALVQKLMPKLRGIETSGDMREKCLETIKSIIDSSASGIAYDFDIALNNPYGVFVWTSSSYLEKDI